MTTAIGSADDTANAIVLQPDGRLVVAGSFVNASSNADFALARYNTNGTLDGTFASNGKATTAIGSGTDEALALALQPDGKLVAAGYSFNGSDDDFAVVRYNAGGGLNTTFGSNGKVTTSIGPGADQATAVLIQAEGKIVAAGYSFNGSNRDFALVRYNANGTLDTTFGNGGKVTTPIGNGTDEAAALIVQPDGKLVAAGRSFSGSSYDFALARYNADGSLDAGFGNGGVVTTAVGASTDQATALALQLDNKLVVGGFSVNGATRDFAVARYTSNGSLDASFGSGGTVVTPIGAGTDEATAVVLQSDGKIVAAGRADIGGTFQFAVARYTAGGVLDPGFGTGGKVTTSIQNAGDEARAMILQLDGNLVAAGRSFKSTDYDIGLVRYVGDSPPPPTGTPTFTPTQTPSATATASNTPSATRTPTTTATATRTATFTPTFTPTNTGTRTATPTPTSTPSPTRTSTPTGTSTPTSTSTYTPTRTATATATPTSTGTATRTPTRTSTATATSSRTPTATRTSTPTKTPTPSRSPTRTPTNTATPTVTPSATRTATPTWTGTPTSTGTPTPTQTATPTVTSTYTPSPLAPTPPLICPEGILINKPVVRVRRNANPPGDELLFMKGEVNVVAPIDPLRDGFTYFVGDYGGVEIFSRILSPILADPPEGEGWKVNHSYTRWTYFYPPSSSGDWKRVIIKKSRFNPSLIKFSVLSRKANFQVFAYQTPVQEVVVFGSDQCALRTFAMSSAEGPSCALNTSGKTLICR